MTLHPSRVRTAGAASVAFAARGRALLAAANAVKKPIEKDDKARLGPEGFAQLRQALDRLDAA